MNRVSGELYNNVSELIGYTKPRFPVITMCGSTRFPDVWSFYNAALSIRGCIVHSVGLFGRVVGLDMSSETKRLLDRVYLQKIEMSDAILVLNKDGYIGLSTWDEILFAASLDKLIYFIEPLPDRCLEELNTLRNRNETMWVCSNFSLV